MRIPQHWYEYVYQAKTDRTGSTQASEMEKMHRAQVIQKVKQSVLTEKVTLTQ